MSRNFATSQQSKLGDTKIAVKSLLKTQLLWSSGRGSAA
jgi:hypothetical protein